MNFYRIKYEGAKYDFDLKKIEIGYIQSQYCHSIIILGNTAIVREKQKWYVIFYRIWWKILKKKSSHEVQMDNQHEAAAFYHLSTSGEIIRVGMDSNTSYFLY